jgi:hypothetical protein
MVSDLSRLREKYTVLGELIQAAYDTRVGTSKGLLGKPEHHWDLGMAAMDVLGGERGVKWSKYLKDDGAEKP